MVRLFHLLWKGNQVLFIIRLRVNKLFGPQTCVHFMKFLPVTVCIHTELISINP